MKFSIDPTDKAKVKYYFIFLLSGFIGIKDLHAISTKLTVHRSGRIAGHSTNRAAHVQGSVWTD
jgi:hypothetical protein